MRFIFLFILLFLSGCASISGRRQAVYVKSDPPGAIIKYNGDRIGITPSMVLIDRKPHREIELSLENDQQVANLEGKYRWWQSFGLNSFLLGYAPIGWLVDLATGAAWQLPESVEVNLNVNKNIVREKNPAVVAIAPPLSNHPNLSDEIGRKLESELLGQFPKNVKMIPYDESLHIFEDEDVTGDIALEKEHLPYLFARLQASHLVVTELQNKGEDVVVAGNIYSYDNEIHKMPIQKSIEKSDLHYNGESIWNESDGVLFYFLPNSISVDLSDSNTSFQYNNVTYYGETETPDGFAGDLSRVFSAVGIRRSTPPIDRPGWRGRVYFIPTANFSYGEESFPYFAPVLGKKFLRTHIDAGYGPSFTYSSRKSLLYLNLLPTLAWNEIRSEGPNGDVVESEGVPEVAIEFGYAYYFNFHWSTRLFYRSVDVPEHLWEDVFSQVAGQKVDITAPSLHYAGVSLSYTLPNKFSLF